MVCLRTTDKLVRALFYRKEKHVITFVPVFKCQPGAQLYPALPASFSIALSLDFQGLWWQLPAIMQDGLWILKSHTWSFPLLLSFPDPIWIDSFFFFFFLMTKSGSNMEKLPEWSPCLYSIRSQQCAKKTAPKQAFLACCPSVKC